MEHVKQQRTKSEIKEKCKPRSAASSQAAKAHVNCNSRPDPTVLAADNQIFLRFVYEPVLDDRKGFC